MAALLQPELGGGGGCSLRRLAESEAVAQWRDWKVRRCRDAGVPARPDSGRLGVAAICPRHARAGWSGGACLVC